MRWVIRGLGIGAVSLYLIMAAIWWQEEQGKESQAAGATRSWEEWSEEEYRLYRGTGESKEELEELKKSD